MEEGSSGVLPCGHCKSVNRPDTWEPHKWLIWAESLAGQAPLGHRHRDALFSPESIARAWSRQPDKERHHRADSPLIYRSFDEDRHWINRPLFCSAPLKDFLGIDLEQHLLAKGNKNLTIPSVRNKIKCITQIKITEIGISLTVV